MAKETSAGCHVLKLLSPHSNHFTPHPAQSVTNEGIWQCHFPTNLFQHLLSLLQPTPTVFSQIKKIYFAMKNFLLLCTVACNLMYAQRHSDHFVVTTKGDTIYGHLKYQTSGGELHNKVEVKVNDTLKLSFEARDLIYFEEGLNEYYSFVPEGQKESFFMRVWAVGYYELFEWEVPYSISPSALIEYRPLLRKKGDKEFIKLDPKLWRTQLANLFSDFEELATDVKKGRYPMDEMNHIIDRYNEWKEEEDQGGW
jgi:hypothetical protein